METQTQIDRLIELAIIQRSELKQLVEQLPQLREHLNAEVERTFEEAEPQIRTELEEFVTRQAADKTATLGVALEAKIGELAKSLEESAQAKYSALIATRDQNATLLAQAEERIAAAAGELPAKVKDIVAAELARFPRAGEIDQLRKEFAEPRGLNPRGKWQADQTYNKLDLVTINGDSYTSNIDGNRTRPSRSSADWTLVAARGTGGGGGPTSLSELTTVPNNGDILIGSGTSWVTSNLTAGAGISITVGAGEITISATDGDITLDDGTAASPSLHFTNDADTGLYRPAANTLGISVSGTQVAYFDTDGLTIPSAGVVAGGSFHGANGNANNPTFSFESDQDTGMYRHGTNELGFTIGGTEKAVMTSTTFTVTPNLVVSGAGTSSIGGNLTVSGTGTQTLNGKLDVITSTASAANVDLAVLRQNYAGTAGHEGFVSFTNISGTSVGKIGTRAVDGNNTSLVLRNFVTGSLADALVLSPTTATLAGNLTVSGTGTSSFAGQVTSSINSATAANGASFLASSGDVNCFMSYSSSASADQKYWGWQSGSAIGDGTYRLRAFNDALSAGISALTFTRSGISSIAATLNGNLTVSGGTVTSGTGTLTLNSSANTVVLQSAGTTALTLDSSQRCILAGALRLNNAYTAGAPTATGYVTLQDSAGNTYKVLVGT